MQQLDAGGVSTAKVSNEPIFFPEDVRILAAAFDAAWASVEAGGARFGEKRHKERARTILAKAIIRVAGTGERDRRNLTVAALLELSKALSHKSAL
jgi:hypothetical protein